MRGFLVRSLVLLLLAAAAPARAQFVPYFGKNKVTYDSFAWRVYKSPHFEVYYYPEFEQHLGARRLLRGERATRRSRRDLKHEIALPDPAHPLQDALRVRADEPVPRLRARGRAGLHGAGARPHGAAHRPAAGPAAGPDHPRADPRLRVRPHPAQPGAAPRAAVGRRGPGRLHARHLGLPRPHDHPRRRRHRPGPAHDPLRGLRRALEPARRLQPRPRRLRVHRGPLRQGRASGSSSTPSARTSWAAGMDDIYMQAFRMQAGGVRRAASRSG